MNAQGTCHDLMFGMCQRMLRASLQLRPYRRLSQQHCCRNKRYMKKAPLGSKVYLWSEISIIYLFGSLSQMWQNVPTFSFIKEINLYRIPVHVCDINGKSLQLVYVAKYSFNSFLQNQLSYSSEYASRAALCYSALVQFSRSHQSQLSRLIPEFNSDCSK